MWHLEKFDKTTQLLMGEHVLHDMSAAVVGRILGIADDENELPIGIRQHDVPLSKASEFAAFLNEAFTLDENASTKLAILQIDDHQQHVLQRRPRYRHRSGRISISVSAPQR